MSDIAIQVSGISKQFRIGGRQEDYKTLRDTVADAVQAPLRGIRSLVTRGPKASRPVSWALRDVSFNVSRGDALAVIGRNGAGKSTLLKVLSRITEPTSGFAEMYGRVGSLLEVGTGFHPELTGRENTFLNGATLGMTRQEVVRKFDEIVAFSEVEKFIDTPVKHYSSGMYLRLAFAVAAHLEPEILLMDEVLAVGDAAFQRKCLGKMGSVAQAGRTVVFVSHNMSAVRELCGKAVWLEAGRLVDQGDVDTVAHNYLRSICDSGFSCSNDSSGFSVESVRLCDSAGKPRLQFEPGEDLLVEIAYHALVPLVRPFFMLLIEGLYGRCFAANMLLDGCRPASLEGRGTLRCRFRNMPLLPQSYSVKMWIRGSDNHEVIVPLQDVATFEVTASLEECGLRGEYNMVASRSTSVMIPYDWILPDGSVRPFQLGTANASAPAVA